ncbi:MAG: 2OG-Fe(II) oxygenase [Myxococcales bacterium]|nr:2OG-Fe(II) oxygenase [Myxococcales bacterium]
MFDVDVQQKMIFTLPDVLSSEECNTWIQRIRDAAPAPAPISTYKGPVMNSRVRNNNRVMFNDLESAQDIFLRIKDRVPQEMKGHLLVGANELLRCYEYTVGQYFAPHADGCFARDDDERSFYTYLIYLNDGFEGGETTFFTEPEVVIQPKQGMALFFQHPIYHEGCAVTKGVKYALRSDLMYRRPPTRQS